MSTISYCPVCLEEKQGLKVWIDRPHTCGREKEGFLGVTMQDKTGKRWFVAKDGTVKESKYEQQNTEEESMGSASSERASRRRIRI